MPKLRVSEAVLDASALLALLNGERGAEDVRVAIHAGAHVSTVNLSEVVATLADRGLDAETIRAVLESVQITVIPFDEALAVRAGVLRPLTRRLGLSFGDRACLALAQALGLPALTADRAWAGLSVGVTVEFIR